MSGPYRDFKPLDEAQRMLEHADSAHARARELMFMAGMRRRQLSVTERLKRAWATFMCKEGWQ